MQTGLQMLYALGGIFKKIEVQHAQAVAHGGFVLDGEHFFQRFGGFLVAPLVVHDDAKQVQGLGVGRIQRYGPLGKGFSRVPVLRADEVLHQVDHGGAVIGVFRNLAHELADLLGIVILSARLGSRAGPPLLGEAGTFKTLLERSGQHDHKAQGQQENKRARRRGALGTVSHD